MPAARRASSPIRSPNPCSTAPVSPIPAIPNISANWRAKLYARPARPVMLLWSRELAVVPGDHPCPAGAGSRSCSRPTIWSRSARSSPRLSGAISALTAPRLAFAGLNPHAGEDGAIGREDIDIIAPAVARLAARGFDVRGPLPADTMFHAAARKTYDVAICAYHDQALIPIKTLGLRQRGQCHPRPALHPHLARPWHGLRHRRNRPGQRNQPRRGDGAGRAHGHGALAEARMTRRA